MDLIGIKLLLLVAVLAAGALGAGLPVLRPGALATGRLLSWSSSFAAGVFLGAGLIHMLPTAHAMWQQLGWDYPMAFTLAAAAVVLLLLVEHVLLPEHAHAMVHEPAGRGRAQIGSYAVAVALSVHALLEGLALGAQSLLGGALVVFGAILAHKTTAGFALGVSLARSNMPRGRALRILALFALATPLGILLGALGAGSLDGHARGLFEAVFLSLAAGTFAYVATFDILRDELNGPGSPLSKWGFVMLGTCTMGALALFV